MLKNLLKNKKMNFFILFCIIFWRTEIDIFDFSLAEDFSPFYFYNYFQNVMFFFVGFVAFVSGELPDLDAANVINLR